MTYSTGISATDGLDLIGWSEATEMTKDELTDIIAGRKELFNRFYPQVVSGMRARGNQFLAHVARYRDRNIEVLSAPTLVDYSIFSNEDQKIVWKVTDIDEADVDAEIKKLKTEIHDGCVHKGYKPPTESFKNLTAFRVCMLLIMRYYLERGEKDKLAEACSYTGYSMFYTLFRNFFPYGIRPETMAYTMSTMTKKHKLKQQKDVDGLLEYGIERCVVAYRQRIMDCTDHDIIYVINQFKSRLRDYFRSIASKYHENDKKKEAVFISTSAVASGDEGDETEFIDRGSKAGDIEKYATQYTTRFFQKPLDEEILTYAAKLGEVPRQEIKNALTTLRSDRARIHELKTFYECLFYLYLANDDSHDLNPHSKKFLAAMDAVYKKGNSHDKNIVTVKGYLDSWLTATSASYREATRASKINGFRKAIYEYFIFAVALRR